eukprot:CAMPEP_0197327268 /NCGR_PEP_ID=MMETSP0892-20130614/2605_1 /TAXON_ID=44058 ORGANISM="Aureoumbra lagunensis, Strain CCMP1510" /NCGR_SAMPLE_ID=MMETSP0892 /ASSEMBLY_ACC=CAM_ASM_000538 /LENGTH=635 /DNA_ID=CAMNT_0042821949 /DNA_START=176 /DNA_END=2080 /DNA_ORIENTATION=+
MAFNHCVGDVDLLTDIEDIPASVESVTHTADGSIHRPTKQGTLHLILPKTNGENLFLSVSNVYYVPNWPKHQVLLSIGQLEQARDPHGHRIFYKTDDFLCFLKPSTANLTSSTAPPMPPSNKFDYCRYQRNRLHYIQPLKIGPSCRYCNKNNVVTPTSSVCASTPALPQKVSAETAHYRFGCINNKYVKATISKGRGLTLTEPLADNPMSEASLHGMSKRQPLIKTKANPAHKSQRNISSRIVPELHMDVHGPYIDGINKAKYFVSYTTNDSYSFVYFLRDIDEDSLITSYKAATLETGTPKVIRMDRNQTLIKNDPIILTKFKNLLFEQGVALKISPPGHQEMDGVAEKSGGRDIYEHATALLHYAGLSKRFWPFAVQHFVYVFNMVPRPHLKNGESPFFLNFGTIPYLGDIRIFGCPAFVHKDKNARKSNAAFSSRVDRCINLGLALDSPPGTYMLYKFSTRSIIISRDITFFDEHFRFITRTPNGWQFQPSLIDSEYNTILEHPTGLEFVEADIPSESQNSPNTSSDLQIFDTSGDTIPSIPPRTRQPPERYTPDSTFQESSSTNNFNTATSKEQTTSTTSIPPTSITEAPTPPDSPNKAIPTHHTEQTPHIPKLVLDALPPPMTAPVTSTS